MQQEISATEQNTEEVKPAAVDQPNPVPVSKQAKDESNLNQEIQSVAPAQETLKKKEENKQQEKKTVEAEAKPENNVEEQVDMTGK